MPIYKDIFQGPARNYSRGGDGKPVTTTKKWIAIHCTDNRNLAPARDEMSYAKRRTDSVSAHYYADDREVVQALDTAWISWHAGSSSGNSGAISYELTARQSWTRQQWLSGLAWDKLAAQVRRDMQDHNIPARVLTVDELKQGKPGFTSHNQLRLAFGGTDHTCPGPNFPMDHLIELVTQKGTDVAEKAWRTRSKPEKTVAKAFPGVRDDGYLRDTWLQYTYMWARRAAERWAGKVLPNSWMARRWNIPAEGWSRDVWLRSGYGHARAAHDNTVALVEAVSQQAAELRAIRDLLGQVLDRAGAGPVDMAAVEAAARAGAQEALSRLDVRVEISPAAEPTTLIAELGESDVVDGNLLDVETIEEISGGSSGPS